MPAHRIIMKNTLRDLAGGLDWTDIAMQLDLEGYALLPGLLGAEQARTLARLAVASASSAGGCGKLFDTADPLPGLHAEPQSNPLPESLADLLAEWHQAFYAGLAPIANRWNEAMGVASRYPATLDELQRQDQRVGRKRTPSSFSRLREADYQALHQGLSSALPQTVLDESVFPLQWVVLLSEPGRDFSGGEFVMTEQRPRMQSRPMVLPLNLGDAAIITVARRPVKGGKGYYRVNLKHAVSRVRGGERIGLELVFHGGR